MNAKKVLGLVAACLVIILTGLIGINSAKNYNTSVNVNSKPLGKYYASVSISGEIMDVAADAFGIAQPSYNHRATLDYIYSLIDDSNNTGLLLYLDTPGGNAYTGVELYRAVMDYKELTGRVVVASMGSMCASAGYYVASAADYIFADAESITGSIGVYMALTDTSALYEKLGIKTVLVATGNNKGTGMSGLPITDEQKAVYQEIVDDTYSRFVAAVAEGRGMSQTQVAPLADGRIFSANRALKEGLIDEIGTFDDAISYMDDITDSQYYYQDLYKQNVWSILLSQLSEIMPKSENQILKELAEKEKGGLMMLYGAN